MRNFKTKFVVAILAFTIGVIGVWISGVLSSLNFIFAQPDLLMEIDEVSTEKVSNNEPFAEQAFGNIEIRFKRHLKIEDSNYAEFEIVNRNSLPIGYMGYGKNSHCTTAVKINHKVEQNNLCWCGTGLELQVLRTGETALYQVSESEVRQLLKREILKVTKHYTTSEGLETVEYIPDRRKVTTQVGFEFIVGAERRKEIVWSQKLSFPK
jgi:hypothetical protein